MASPGASAPNGNGRDASQQGGIGKPASPAPLSLFAELKRRNVIKVAGAYLVSYHVKLSRFWAV